MPLENSADLSKMSSLKQTVVLSNGLLSLTVDETTGLVTNVLLSQTNQSITRKYFYCNYNVHH